MEQNNILSVYINKNRDQAAIDNITKFLAYNQNRYLDPALNGYGYVFVTKPCLFIYPFRPDPSNTTLTLAYRNMCKDPYFTMFIPTETGRNEDTILAKQLSFGTFSDVTSLFLPIFTNATKQISTSDITIDSINAFATREGYNVPMPTHKTGSETSGTISLNVTETANLDFIKLTGLWVNYMTNITNGTFNANPDMIKNNMLDYTSSIYYFLVAPDGKTLKYWCRYTSCYPTSIPYSALSYQRGTGDKIELDISFQYTLKEDMNPQILEDFNMLALGMVNATYTDTTYDAFLQSVEETEDLEHTSYVGSPLLSKSKLINGSTGSLLNSDDRDPIVFFETESSTGVYSDNRPGRYVLSWGKTSLSDTLLNSLLEDSGAYVYDDLLDNF